MTTAAKRSGETRSRIAAEQRVALIENIEWLLSCRVGEAAILASTGYAHKPLALQRLLMRENRHDLIPRIFEWQAEYEERHHPKKAA